MTPTPALPSNVSGGTSLALALRSVMVVEECEVWQRWERDLRRALARANDIAVELHFLDAPIEELTARMAARNHGLPQGTPRIDAGLVALQNGRIQRPDADQLALFDAPSEPSAIGRG